MLCERIGVSILFLFCWSRAQPYVTLAGARLPSVWDETSTKEAEEAERLEDLDEVATSPTYGIGPPSKRVSFVYSLAFP